MDLDSDDVTKPATLAAAQTCPDLLPGQDPINASICLASLSWVSGTLNRPLFLPWTLFFPTTDSLASGPHADPPLQSTPGSRITLSSFFPLLPPHQYSFVHQLLALSWVRRKPRE